MNVIKTQCQTARKFKIGNLESFFYPANIVPNTIEEYTFFTKWNTLPKDWDRQKLLHQLYTYLKEQAQQDLSGCDVIIKNDIFRILYRTQNYLVDYLTNKPQVKWVKLSEIGPSPDGLMISVFFTDRAEELKDTQVINMSHWVTYLKKIYLPELNIYLCANISYGDNVKKKTLQKYTSLRSWLEAVSAKERLRKIKAEHKYRSPKIFEKMLDFMKADDGQNMMVWIQSLDKKDIIEGIMQGHIWLLEQKLEPLNESGDIGWQWIVYPMAGFVESYFRIYPNQSPEPFLKMAADKSLDRHFRMVLLGIMGDNDFYNLTPEHFNIFSDILLNIINDQGNTFELKREAIDCLRGSVGGLFHVKRNAQPALKDIKRLDEILAVSETKISVQSRKFFEDLAYMYHRLVKSLLSVAGEKMDAHQKHRFVKRLSSLKDGGYITDSILIEELDEKIIEIQSELQKGE